MKIQDLVMGDVVHCDTEEKATAFCKMMSEAGLRWSNGQSYTDKNYWHTHKANTCYNPKSGTFSDKEYFISKGSNIIPFEQIEAKEFPLDVLSLKDEFVPGVYWHFLGSNVELKYIDSQEQVYALGGTFELIKECEQPAPKLVKWIPSLEVPKKFWIFKNEKFFCYQCDRVTSDSRGIFVSSGMLEFESGKVYVENS